MITAFQRLHPYRRLLVALAIVIGVNLLLAIGYWLLNLDRTNDDGSPITFDQCLYMTVISTFTVGYGEAVPIKTPLDRFYTMLVIFIGIAMIGFGLSQMTAFFVEGELRNLLGRLTMDQAIASLRNHFVICGLGDTGYYASVELHATKRPFVVIDPDEARLKKMAEATPFLYLVGDATDDVILEKAGIRHAAGVLCAMPNDRDNLFLAMTCRQLNRTLRIVSKVHDVHLGQRLRNAGADSVVSPQFIGGLRLVSELTRPTAVTFLDRMLRDRDTSFRIEEVRIEAGSSVAGKLLGEAGLAHSGALVMALQKPGAEQFIYVPPMDSVLEPGSTIIVLATPEQVRSLRKASGIISIPSPTPPSSPGREGTS